MLQPSVRAYPAPAIARYGELDHRVVEQDLRGRFDRLLARELVEIVQGVQREPRIGPGIEFQKVVLGDRLHVAEQPTAQTIVRVVVSAVSGPVVEKLIDQISAALDHQQMVFRFRSGVVQKG